MKCKGWTQSGKGMLYCSCCFCSQLPDLRNSNSFALMLSVQHRPSWCMAPFQPPVITSEEGRSTDHALQYLKLARSICLFLKKGKATHSNILAWRTPWTEEPGGLQSMGLQRVGHYWETNTYIHMSFPLKSVDHATLQLKMGRLRGRGV